MARNETFIAASPRAVFEVLSDPRSYAHWVAGSRAVRAADERWPAPGTKFDHTVGTRLVKIRDHTSVLASRPPVMLQLCARARPLPDARVTLHLQPEGSGTRVTMIEAPANRVLSLLFGPLGHALIRLRNVESLKRLKELAEGRTPRPSGSLPPRAAHAAR